MQCPDCGHEVDDTAVFCPYCRYQFWETDDTPFVPDASLPDTPARDNGVDESFFKENQNGFPVRGMQCPDCGHEVDDTAVFCPYCRFRFREHEAAPSLPSTTPETPARDNGIDESIFTETKKRFSVKELRKLDVQLLQPAFLVVLILSLFTYTVIATVPFMPVTLAGLNFGVTGIISLVCGLLAGIVFFFLIRRSLSKFQYR